MEVIFGPLLASFDFGIFRVFGAIFRFVVEYWKVFAVILIILSFKYGFFEVFGIAFSIILLYLAIVFWAVIIYVAYDTICWICGDFSTAVVVILGLLGIYALFEKTNFGEAVLTYTFLKWLFKK